jgi:hypothetical protein
MLTEFGSLVVNVGIANEARPIVGALVRISGADEDNKDLVRTLITDNDGVTQKIRLPAKNKSYSQAPNSAETPYSRYNLEIEKDGFYTKKINGISVFSGVESIQIVSMIPSSNNLGEYFPNGNINANLPDTTI